MYNLHGINNGRSGLLNLCNNVNIHIIAVQEHWLHDSNLHLLNSIHPDFVGFSISSMSLLKTVLKYTMGDHNAVSDSCGKKTLTSRTKIGARAVSGRCLSATVTLDSGEAVNVVNVWPTFHVIVLTLVIVALVIVRWLGGLLVERRTSVSQIRGSIPRQVAAV